ncbi:hypothetical protein HUU39_14250 [candidate division KSB1 bacterium]|nr:hypothetical protein [bacterium]NUM66412.1 hypothetical protein [candidate division KSB1 bacterium]
MAKSLGSRCAHSVALTLGLVMSWLAWPAAQAQDFESFTVVESPIFFLSDFDIAGGGNPAELFQLIISNRTETVRRARIEMTFRRDGSLTPIVRAYTDPFDMQPHRERRFTYRDFRGTGENGDVTIARYEYNPNAIDNIIDNVLRTGRLPNGRYFLSVTISEMGSAGDPTEKFEERELFVSSLPSLDLVAPGMPAGELECPVVFTNLPQFKWDSEADVFVLTVCELLPTNSGPEDVMQNPPRLRLRLQRNLHFFGSPTLQYPSEGLPLQEGRTYYWQVNALVPTQTGELELPGQIWCFRISTFGGSENELLLQQLLALLQSLGLQDVNQLFEAGGPLEGYLPSGTVMLNGRRIDLNELITQLRANARRLSGFVVE